MVFYILPWTFYFTVGIYTLQWAFLYDWAFYILPWAFYITVGMYTLQWVCLYKWGCFYIAVGILNITVGILYHCGNLCITLVVFIRLGALSHRPLASMCKSK
jgi:hypothetical protein